MARAARRRLLATGQSSHDLLTWPPSAAGVGARAEGSRRGGAGKFASRVRRPGAPAVVAQVLSGWVAMELPAVNLKAILLVHWLLTTWGCIVFQGPYAWTNFPILALGVWAMAQRDSVDAISMFLGGLVATIFLDVIYIGIFYPRSNLSDTVRFSAGMAILNLILKPISCFFAHHMYRERGVSSWSTLVSLGPQRSAVPTSQSTPQRCLPTLRARLT
uniref:Type-1 angiotensin II receptor-associated protein n=1 Tax=Bos mutus grunniens TaxID=30521 RepID=A0A8C0A897_BOSMU